ncbi:MAG: GNAT family N-acetyltransferase [Bacilli bacterium]|nr:GNAT family N-acetyltransferase [Bacilli bacterium]MDD2681913.1 GNAT family N-acetyltransferase [Bacilli bacterium]MDD3121643.1 GNAT family N-acetyltransferase [Bacilli bacterium]MDD4063720.1 GNAT family N-acetyltransferase [Bacilli bacterium]MDD4482421.1 GNAT family N-acetyltransferase [Bacilli bacterium]
MLLTTDRLIIRKMKDKDINEIYDYRNDERCYKFQTYSSRTIAELKSLINMSQNSTLKPNTINEFAICLKDSDSIVGEIYVNIGIDSIALGYSISYKHFRKGYAFEALTKITLYLHELYPEYELYALVHPGNDASNKLLEKLGFKYEEFIEQLNSLVYTKYSLKEKKEMK